MEEKKQDAITIKTACKLLDCSVSAFYARHKEKLTPIGKDGRVVYYELDSILKYKESVKKIANKYNIVEP